jgi:hypothetical protein
MRNVKHLLAALACGAALAAVTPAQAIECDGNFQVQRDGTRIATPYCQDGNLGRVAREYGVRVSDHEIRWNPSEKGRVCRFVGDDNRVRDTCSNYRNENDNDHFWR